MKVTFNKDRSIASQLSEIVKVTFPSIRETGLTNGLLNVYPEPKSKGKAVKFVWNKTTFRLTENLRVQEFNFCNVYEDTELSKKAADMIVKCLNSRMPKTEPEPVAVNDAVTA